MEKPGDESRGLEFLRKARPAAIEHLLSFFAESARHLDPRTRFLISIVTKVIAGSKRGVRQYVRRAMENGAGPEEVIDAVLCAYPCAGLTRVVDAIDVILAMGIPGISLEERAEAKGPAPTAAPPPAGEAPPAAAPEGGTAPREWVLAGRTSEIPPGTGLLVETRGLAIALFSVEGEVLAVENRCPHRGGSLAGGSLEGGVVTCPLHHWQFDLPSGRCPANPGVAIRTFPVRREGDRILVGI